MSDILSISLGQASDKGRKKINQDFFGVNIPEEPLLSSKGIAIAMADGISSSEVSQYASEAAVKSFLEDYYCTPESWSAKTSVQKVLKATNSWLYSQTKNSPYRFSLDRGYVCTFSTLVLKSNTAHIFHAGDTRVYRVVNKHLEKLTEDHRLWVAEGKSYLRRAMGMKDRLDLDYTNLAIEIGDCFLIATDGIYEFIKEKRILELIEEHQADLDHTATAILKEALDNGSDDNLSLQIVRIDQLPQHAAHEIQRQANTLPLPPELKPRMQFDGYEILRQIHYSHRSQIFLATDLETQQNVVIKVPSIDLRSNPENLERFLMEDWVAHRIDNAHVLKPVTQTRKRNYVYIVTEFVHGTPLSQWLLDNPEPDLETVRNIIEQIAAGLRAFHRQEMLHQDLRPDNIMIDETGTVKIIDFGSTRVAGIQEVTDPRKQNTILGTAQYAAPEYFLGEAGTTRSDMFSLGVICYQMLSGRLPYGTNVARATTRAAQRKLVYQSVLDDERNIPAWIDQAIHKAVKPDPYQRYDEISEFVYDLRHPNKTFLTKTRKPLMQRHPVLFWKMVSMVLLCAVIGLAVGHPAFN